MPRPSKRRSDVIRLHNAVFYAYHGVLTDEQNIGGKFEVDVELHCDLSKGAKSDHLRDTVDYEKVYSCIQKLVLGKKYYLLEALANTIAGGILKEFKKVQTIVVKVRKPSAPVRGVIDHVEVELTRTRR